MNYRAQNTNTQNVANEYASKRLLQQTDEIVIDKGNKTKFLFPDNDEIRYNFLLYLEIWHIDDIGRTPNDNAPLNADAFREGFITLRNRLSQDYYNIPLYAFNPPNNNGVLRRIHVPKWDITDSSLHFPRTNPLVQDEALVFTAHYAETQGMTNEQLHEYEKYVMLQ